MSLPKLLLSAIFLFSFLSGPAQNRCGTSSIDHRDQLNRLLEKSNSGNPVFDISATGNELIVPVVFHILYNNDAQNVSDEQVKSQLDVLNEDFSGENGTSAEIPGAWKNKLTDSNIRFVLAKRTPDANTGNTNGIIRIYTPVPSYQFNDNSIKYSVMGGSDAWPNNKYLNIWVCNLEGGVLGYASFPGTQSDLDGVVIHYEAFGRIGNLKPKYNYGRSATHEIGHWFSLIHIWGDTPDCDPLYDDQVGDTPLQADANLCCPQFPQYDMCTPTGDGVMFMNYMDYTDDKYMQFFTPGQILRMDTAIMNYRGVLSTSDGATEFSIRNTDLSLEEVTEPVREAVNRCFSPVVKVKNMGLSTIHGFTLSYGMYEGNVRVFEAEDTIPSGVERTITLPEISGKDGQNVLEVRITTADDNTVNNYISRSFYSAKENTKGCDDGDLLIYPNPVTGNSFCVKSNFTKSQKLKVRLVNLLGQKLYEKESGSNPGDYFSIPTDNLVMGVYFVQLVGEDDSHSASLLYIPTEGASGGCE